MAQKTVIVQLSGVGPDAGPLFNIYGNADNYSSPLAQNIEVSVLSSEKGFRFNVDSDNTIIRVRSAGICVNYIDRYINCLVTPTPTGPTATPTSTPILPTPTPTPTPTEPVTFDYQYLYATGQNSYGKATLPQSILQQYGFITTPNNVKRRWSKIVAASTHMMGIANQNVYAAGANIVGQLGVNDKKNRYVLTQLFNNSVSQLKDIAVTDTGSFILTGTTLLAAGEQNYGELTTAIPTGGSLVFKPLNGRWSKIVTGSNHTFALSAREDNTKVWFATGLNDVGQLGIGNTNNQNNFTRVAGVWDKIVCGYNSTYGLSNGQWFATGANSYGQLGLGDTQYRTTFTKITGNYTQLYTSSRASFAYALSGNKLYSTGKNVYFQLGLGNNIQTTKFTQIPNIDINFNKHLDVVCGNNHTVLISGTELYGIGDNYYGQIGFNQNTRASSTFTRLTGTWLSAAAGANFTLALGEYTKAPVIAPTPTPTSTPGSILYEDLPQVICAAFAGLTAVNGAYTLHETLKLYTQQNNNSFTIKLSSTENYPWLWVLSQGNTILYTKPGKLIIDPYSIWNVYYPQAQSPAPRLTPLNAGESCYEITPTPTPTPTKPAPTPTPTPMPTSGPAPTPTLPPQPSPTPILGFCPNNVILNGQFINSQPNHRGGTADGWTLNNVYVHTIHDYHGILSEPPNPFLNLVGQGYFEVGGVATQNVNTKPNEEYELSFDLGAVLWSNESLSERKRTVVVKIFDENNITSNTFNLTASNLGYSYSDFDWKRYTINFTAGSYTTTISFSGFTEIWGYGPALDNVCLVGPEPTRRPLEVSPTPTISPTPTPFQFVPDLSRSLIVSNSTAGGNGTYSYQSGIIQLLQGMQSWYEGTFTFLTTPVYCTSDLRYILAYNNTLKAYQLYDSYSAYNLIASTQDLSTKPLNYPWNYTWSLGINVSET